MEEVFKHIIGLGATVVMSIIFTILGVCVDIKPPKALKSGLLVGVGFVSLSTVTALLTSSPGPTLSKMVEVYGLELGIFDMGWSSAAAIAYSTSVSAFIIPAYSGVNLLMLLTETTRTVNIDLWNYWHFVFIGAIVYFASDNIFQGFFVAIIYYIITLVMADITTPALRKFRDKMDGISIPQPFCQSFAPFAIVVNKLLGKIPGFDKLNINPEGMKKKFGLMGGPPFLGVVIGCGTGALGYAGWKEVLNGIPGTLGSGIKMGTVMELTPRITSLFIEGLKPISDATRGLIAKKYRSNTDPSIGMNPALVIGHPTTLVVSLFLTLVTVFLVAIPPDNRFSPLAPLTGMFYLFPTILPTTKGNVVKSFIIGLVALVVSLHLITEPAGFSTMATKDVYAAMGDPTINTSAGFEGGALDSASNPFCQGISHLTYNVKIIGPTILVTLTPGMAVCNRIRMKRNDVKNATNV